MPYTPHHDAHNRPGPPSEDLSAARGVMCGIALSTAFWLVVGIILAVIFL